MNRNKAKGWDDSFMYSHVDPELLQERVALTSMGLGFARTRVHNQKDRAKRIERLKHQFDLDYRQPWRRPEDLTNQELLTPGSGSSEELHPERRAARHRNAVRQSKSPSVYDEAAWKPKSSHEKKLEKSNNLVKTTRSNIRGMDDTERDLYVMGIQSRLRLGKK